MTKYLENKGLYIKKRVLKSSINRRIKAHFSTTTLAIQLSVGFKNLWHITLQDYIIALLV